MQAAACCGRHVMPGTIVDIQRPRNQAGAAPIELAQALGWFSIALGTVELLLPRVLTRLLGLRGQESLVRSYGLREIGTGIGILRSRNPTYWVYGRVGGDALDIATAALGLRGPRRASAALALVSLAGVTALDVICSGMLARRKA